MPKPAIPLPPGFEPLPNSRGPAASRRQAIATIVIGAVLLGACWLTQPSDPNPATDRRTAPTTRAGPTPQEQRELEQAKRTVEATCSLWWDGALELPDHQAQLCVDGGYGK